MELILTTPTETNTLANHYDVAIRQAKELYIASAYLTNWSTKIPLNKHCEKVFFLVGTDFGLTRKMACSSVLKWLPKKFLDSFYAVDQESGNFHPKIVAWKDIKDKAYCIIGSSNLTEAAFANNYEANVQLDIKEDDYKKSQLGLSH